MDLMKKKKKNLMTLFQIEAQAKWTLIDQDEDMVLCFIIDIVITED